ncbi:MAG TPA: response regulator transcription factor [Thermoanaerobaculia bacterium]|nr:response regulator transcription factor [Thermoanaerobaculia bacterium]
MSHAVPRILLVDDDPAIRAALERELSQAGYEVVTAADGAEGLARFEQAEPDLVVTDLAMPVKDGLALIAEVRRRAAVPILVLSVREGEGDKVRALDLGADDYVTKPFSLRELLARVRAQLRRSGLASDDEAVLRFPGLTIDRGRRRVFEGEREVHLTPTELAILELLASRAGKPVTHRQIIAVVWKGAPATSPDTVRVHVGSLRRKLEPDPAHPRYLGTEPWVGYRFLAEPVEG